MEQALALSPFAVDISSGAETNGMKDYTKMSALVEMARRNGGQDG
jgi:phosphoribosylanthranilate isomerase